MHISSPALLSKSHSIWKEERWTIDNWIINKKKSADGNSQLLFSICLNIWIQRKDAFMVSLLFIKKLLLWKLRKENIKEGQTNAKTSNQIFWQFIPFYKFSKWFRSIIVRNQLKSLGHRERIINVSLVERKIRDRDNWFYKILIIFRNLINKRISSINLAGTLTKRTFVAKALLNKKEKMRNLAQKGDDRSKS